LKFFNVADLQSLQYVDYSSTDSDSEKISGMSEERSLNTRFKKTLPVVPPMIQLIELLLRFNPAAVDQSQYSDWFFDEVSQFMYMVDLRKEPNPQCDEQSNLVRNLKFSIVYAKKLSRYINPEYCKWWNEHGIPLDEKFVEHVCSGEASSCAACTRRHHNIIAQDSSSILYSNKFRSLI
jgi:hypothetical protein